MSETFTSYKELPEILDQAVQKDSQIVSTLQQYIIEYAGDFEAMKTKIANLAFDPLVFHDKDKPADSHEFHSEIFKRFPKISVKFLLQVNSYEHATNKLKKFANKQLESMHAHYSNRISTIKHNIVEELTKYNRAKKANKEARTKFIDAGNALKDAEAKGVKDLSKLIEDFKQARFNAIKVNNESIQIAESITQNIESILSQIEEHEIWRTEEVKSILLDFASTLTNIGNYFVTSSSDVEFIVQELPLESDSSIIAQFEKFRPAQTDDCFQPWNVHPLASKFLTKDQLFKKEVESGNVQLFSVTEDYTGISGHLNAYKGEIVCGMKEQDEEFYLCKNINDSVGLLPKSILTPFE
ncbi:SH3 domain containing protein [Trichomonas vaginalis G3]|uniref:SH3 domain containing protein n=1 Tax=Trichomonas vaginalis (strain ATCC PRA-98 / G3) TaxID=412133 RepID=A2G7I4_TRIV3|nr:SH3-domain family [Trichomonas vaginalis G3]EAX86888.1 SH3 domain containing protein [Trichomonas vaginalis G3]KAI5535749.1 SH3-domain family [Trichomonas vaginalis G3]|eukprot:XP_001299818.1 SH3 domain containing protein [Trichomonas vaginalis G3]